MKRVVPELYESDPNLRELKEIFNELSVRGLVRIHGNNHSISLTGDGFDEVSKTWRRRLVEVLNNNPGLAIIISLFILIVTVVALFKSTN